MCSTKKCGIYITCSWIGNKISEIHIGSKVYRYNTRTYHKGGIVKFLQKQIIVLICKRIAVTLQRRADTIAKILILSFNDDEEKAIERVLSVLSDEIGLEPVQAVTSPVLSFPNLEIKLYQRRVLRDGEDVSLTRLEYGALCYLAASPGRVFTKEQIFEAVWSMESESCQSSVTNVIYSLRKKIEPDSKKPTYIKTVLGMGYKFASAE